MSDLQAAAERVRHLKHLPYYRYADGSHVPTAMGCDPVAITANEYSSLLDIRDAFLQLTDPTPPDEAWLDTVAWHEGSTPDEPISGWRFHDVVVGCSLLAIRVVQLDADVFVLQMANMEEGERPDWRNAASVIVTTRGQLNSLLHAVKGE